MSGRPAWGLPAWGSRSVWHTSKSAGLVISITEPVEVAALLDDIAGKDDMAEPGGGGAEDMARRCSSGCSGCRVRLHRSMAAGVRALRKDGILMALLSASSALPSAARVPVYLPEDVGVKPGALREITRG